LAVEYGHVDDDNRRCWLAEAIEGRLYAPSKQQVVLGLKSLVQADLLERFLATRFPTSA
jgi:2-oxoglutarate dehydrogenase complex dehydrogenase (E1) component-like enzyme